MRYVTVKDTTVHCYNGLAKFTNFTRDLFAIAKFLVKFIGLHFYMNGFSRAEFPLVLSHGGFVERKGIRAVPWSRSTKLLYAGPG